MKRLFALLPLLLMTAAAPASDVTGNWVTEDGTALIAIGRCGNSVCGKVAKALVIKPGRAETDVKNPDPRLRKRPIIGMTILSGFKTDGGGWKDGRIYDPETGKTYRSRLRLNTDGSLKVSGCILFVCQSQRWTRPR
ncbi:DUF2147 domain-containing protein [Sphingosinicella humi]|uniref:DUF2147 domain-containing protein n=1 Tax=Allosphingosinicella humi TaxID=2068657 RepID=A0A2U2IZK2_9SPHN|nr:DUF2147 domain-containing protein [Sphingosinicella humi]PWG01516.1 DUF2147 domain-containing protein [Sphingosinicella humi]